MMGSLYNILLFSYTKVNFNFKIYSSFLRNNSRVN